MSLNKVMLIGNVGRDPEVRYLENNPAPQGTNPKVAQFTLATSERYRDRNGETRENTEWHNIVAWRGLADLAEKYIRKGTQIYVEGHLRTRSWNDQAGIRKDRTEIVADTIQLLGRKSDNPGSQPSAPYQQQGGYSAQPSYQQAPSAEPAGFAPRNTAPAQPTPAQPTPAPQGAPDYQETDDLPF